MSTKVISAIVSILVMVLPLVGVSVGTEQLTSTIQTVVVIVSGLWVWYRTVTKENLGVFGTQK